MKTISWTNKTKQTAILPVRTAETAEAQETAAPKTRQTTAKEDKLSLSQQALAALEDYNRRQAELKAERERLERMKEAGKQQADALAKALKVRMLCWQIAARIMDGDKVPHEDEQFLLNNDPAGYQMAMSLRKVKEDPEEWDSLLEDEEESGGTGAAEGSASAEEISSEGGEAVSAE